MAQIVRCDAGLEETTQEYKDSLKLHRKDYLFDFLVSEALSKVEGNKLYGFDIDTTNPRDVIAILYAMYVNKELMVKAEKES